MIDFNQFPMQKKPYADSTLRCMQRKEIIAYIRDIEHNYESLYWLYQNTVNANLDKFKNFERVVRCRECKHYDEEHEVCCVYLSYRLAKNEDDFCSDAERRTDG